MPSSAIGIATAGTNVARQSCRKRYVIRITSTSAITSVRNVSLRKTSVNAVESSARTPLTPAGMRAIHLSTSFLTRCAVSTELASGDL